ncbi:MAG: glycosyltransferase [Phycisphaerales bacterium]|nr:glycosyltransferase [Phycisphaerales bacterium]
MTESPERSADRGGPEGVFDRLSIVVLAFNRRQALGETLDALRPINEAGAEVIVADNASADDTSAMVNDRFPWARLLTLATNLGVAGFNRGADLATRDILLILDDDARPDPAGLADALGVMLADTSIGGVMLRRTHPKTGLDEWPFDRVTDRRRNWPDMGCGNLIRRDAWNTVGGYEEHFFLYRNDTDMALKLLGAGFDVLYDPSWRVWHDSPTVQRQKPRWFRLSTRNWVWMCRRHGRGITTLRGVLLGWAWAHKLAGMSASRQWSALRGGVEGLIGKPPKLPESVRPDGSSLGSLLRLKSTLRKSRDCGTGGSTASGSIA